MSLKKTFLVIFSLSFLFAMGLYLFQEKKSATENVKKGEQRKLATQKDQEKVATLKFKPLNSYEESALLLGQLMDRYSKNYETSSDSLIRDLDSLGLGAFKTTDGIPGSSEMSIVRTQSSLPGVRYFHAQFFRDEKGTEFLQHMSFELKPGGEGLARASEMAKSFLNHDVTKEHVEENLHLWKMSNGRNLYVKVMQKEDLKDQPFNAYTLADVGTIRFVLEQEIHEDDSAH